MARSHPQSFAEQVVARIGVSLVLPERFPVGDANRLPTSGAPAAAAFQVFVDPVLLEQPVALAGMAREHLQLQVEGRGNVDDEVGSLRRSVPIPPFDRVDKVQVRNVSGRRGRLPLMRPIIRDAGVEERVANKLGRDLVV